MSRFIEWASMGGYASYVWTAYGALMIVLLMNVITSRWQRVKNHKKLLEWIKRQSG